MSARPWRVECSAPGEGPGSEWHRNTNYGFYETSKSAAREVASWLLVSQSPVRYRLVNRITAEIVYLNAQGQPIPAEPEHHGRTRSVEEEMADRAGDRYERGLAGEL